jgi:hypothetical protein
MAQTAPAAALRKALSNAKASARKKGLAFTLSLDQLGHLYQTQYGRCALSGLEFHDEELPEALVKRPFGLSIDRIDPSKGYTIDNVQLVLVAANFIRNQWGDDVLRQISRAIANHELAKTREWRRQLEKRIRLLEQEAQNGPTLQRLKINRQIAGLKATLTKGPSRLRGAARRASRRSDS